ncbi:MAG: lamin tail domain-containing protein [Bacteroidota bacterium]|jgi:hypothetical protein|nr:lamin tail domain-containing protein [Bacteroidota bacterium]
MKTKFYYILCLFFLLSCTTDDILPAVTLSVDNTQLSEDNQTVELIAVLNSSADESLNIPISISGTAQESVDFSISASEIQIEPGSLVGSISITSIQDNETEDVEQITISIMRASDVIVLSSDITIDLLDDDSDSDGDGIVDAEDDCPSEAGYPEYNGCPQPLIIINEVLYDPPSGNAGDANGDGTREAQEDEFIEFYNMGGQIDISGYTISDAAQERHVFPSGTILPANGVLVLFGGGNPTGSFGGAIVQTASTGLLNMNNAGDMVTMHDSNGNEILTFDVEPLSNNPDEAYTRYPDLNEVPNENGDIFFQHAGIAEADGRLFSPGTKLDGTNFN